MSALNSAVKQGLIDRNPAAKSSYRKDLGVSSQRGHRQSSRVSSRSQVTTISTRCSCCSCYLACVAERRSDCGGATSTSTRAGCMLVSSPSWVGADVLSGEPKSRAGRRVVVLDTATITLLECHRRDQDRRRQKAGAGWKDHGLVFTMAMGSSLDPSLRLATLRPAGHQGGAAEDQAARPAAHLGLHRAGVGGVPDRGLPGLGHSSIAVTADIYTDAAPTWPESQPSGARSTSSVDNSTAPPNSPPGSRRDAGLFMPRERKHQP